MAHPQVIFIWLSLIFILSTIKFGHSQPQFTYTNCSITPDTYATNDIFHQNLRIVLSNLTITASTSNSTFHNSSFGQEHDAVYGLYLCRGDLTPRDCSSCINNVAEGIVNDCQTKKEAITWDEVCMLRYANRNIFSKEEESPRHNWTISVLVKPQEVAPSIVLFNLTTSIYSLINETAFSDYSSKANRRYFSTRDESYLDSLMTNNKTQWSYSLAQCTPDISQFMCQKCLTQAYELVRGSTRGFTFFPSCHIRYAEINFIHNGKETYVPSPLPPTTEPPPTRPGDRNAIVIGISCAVAILVLSAVGFFAWNRNIKPSSDGENITMESSQYDIDTIKAAVNNFSANNKLGRGGFGDVYKGTLENGQEIAVKRLSPNSKQGIQEFKTEVLLVAKLEHKNLVKLFGFCVAEKEKLLIYEYLPYSSLDRLLFDPEMRASLDWETRYKIIDGVSKGLLYLHEDSRYKIVHRDLKPSNILLDKDMTPKISDFGLAKLFGEDTIQDISKRIVGTYGYMAPEYVRNGNISVKSDVYSFGVLVLEIISGRRIRERFFYTSNEESLLQCAWRLWNAKEPQALVDPTLCGSFSAEEATRCIHIGLSCVQEEPDKRPTMASIVSILNNYSNSPPQLPPEGHFKLDDNNFVSGPDQSMGVYSCMTNITALTAR